jgi:hypothetical protein
MWDEYEELGFYNNTSTRQAGRRFPFCLVILIFDIIATRSGIVKF